MLNIDTDRLLAEAERHEDQARAHLMARELAILRLDAELAWHRLSLITGKAFNR